MARSRRLLRPRRITHRGFGWATAATIVISMTISLAALFTIGGFSTIAFTSGSMEPTISEGSLAVTRELPAFEARPGDVVSVTSPDGERVTHRVVATEELSWATALTLRGDANQVDDSNLYVTDRVDKVVFSVPHLGRWADADLLILVLLGASGAGLGLGAVCRGRAHHRLQVAPAGVRTLAISGTALGVVVTAVLTAAPTSAYWTDTALASSGTFSGGNVSTSGTASCTVNGSDIDATWTNAGQRFDYVAALYTADIPAMQVGHDTSPYGGALIAVNNITHTIEPTDFATIADLQATGEYNFTIRLYAHAYGSTNTTDRWLSAGFATIPVHFEQLSGSGHQMRCGHDTSTSVEITAIGSDSGSSSTDFITNVAANTVVGTGEPGASIVLRRAGVQIGSATVSAGGTWSAPVTLIEGSQTIEATATDAVGNTATDTQSVMLDTVAPTVTQQAATCTAVGNPVSGVPGQNWCKVTSLGWTATFADNAGGSGLAPASGRQYNDNGGGWTNYPGQVSMAQANGRVMQARGTDVAGNVGTASGTYYIDGTAPTVTVTYPTNGLSVGLLGLLSGLTAQCGSGNSACGTVTDAISGPASVERSLQRQLLLSTMCFNSAGTGYTSGACGSTFSTATRTGTNWRMIADPNTAYSGLLPTFTLRIRATDAAGNVSSAVQVQWTMV